MSNRRADMRDDTHDFRDELPCSDRQEIELFAKGLRKRWAIPDRVKAEMIGKVHLALRKCRNPRNVTMLSKVIAFIEGQNQKDEHLEKNLNHANGVMDLKMKRAEEGLPNDSIALTTPQVQQLPLPEFLARREGILKASKN